MKDEIINVNRPIKTNEIKAVIKISHLKKHSGPNEFSAGFNEAFKEEITPILLKSFFIIEKEKQFQILFTKLVFP